MSSRLLTSMLAGLSLTFAACGGCTDGADGRISVGSRWSFVHTNSRYEDERVGNLYLTHRRTTRGEFTVLDEEAQNGLGLVIRFDTLAATQKWSSGTLDATCPPYESDVLRYSASAFDVNAQTVDDNSGFSISIAANLDRFPTSSHDVTCVYPSQEVFTKTYTAGGELGFWTWGRVGSSTQPFFGLILTPEHGFAEQHYVIPIDNDLTPTIRGTATGVTEIRCNEGCAPVEDLEPEEPPVPGDPCSVTAVFDECAEAALAIRGACESFEGWQLVVTRSDMTEPEVICATPGCEEAIALGSTSREPFFALTRATDVACKRVRGGETQATCSVECFGWLRPTPH